MYNPTKEALIANLEGRGMPALEGVGLNWRDFFVSVFHRMEKLKKTKSKAHAQKTSPGIIRNSLIPLC